MTPTLHIRAAKVGGNVMFLKDGDLCRGAMALWMVIYEERAVEKTVVYIERIRREGMNFLSASSL